MGKVCDDRCKNEQAKEPERAAPSSGTAAEPPYPDIPGGHADKGREERTHNHIYIDNGKRDIF